MSGRAHTPKTCGADQAQATRHQRSITVLVIHHTRKGDSEDPVEEISGTLGLSGALMRSWSSSGPDRGQRLPVAVGYKGYRVAVQFGDQTCRWTILGNATEVHQSDQVPVLAALEEATEGCRRPKSQRPGWQTATRRTRCCFGWETTATSSASSAASIACQTSLDLTHLTTSVRSVRK